MLTVSIPGAIAFGPAEGVDERGSGLKTSETHREHRARILPLYPH